MPLHDAPWPRYPRSLEGAWHAIDDLRYAVDEMLKTDQIADAITAKMVTNRNIVFGRWEKLVAMAMGFAVVADFIFNMVQNF